MSYYIFYKIKNTQYDLGLNVERLHNSLGN